MAVSSEHLVFMFTFLNLLIFFGSVPQIKLAIRQDARKYSLS